MSNMYQAQSKRIFPRKDEIYRTDIPSHNNYYSSSSVYSYSPTSSTDCPEHGRSRRKLTLILTVSIVLVTLGVLSIAGIAAYLGIISKNSSSQYEEINLLGNTNKLDRKNDYIITNGRSRSDPSIHSQSQFDFTNSIVETKSPHQDHVVNEDDLTQSVVSNTVRYPQRPSTSAVITARPTSTSNSNNQNDRRHNQRFPFPPTTTTLPPTIPIETSTETRRRESATPEAPIIIRAPPTQAPPLKSHDRYHYRNRHRHRYPPTNSHSLPPSSSTTLETTVSESKDRDVEEHQNESSTIKSKPNSSNSQNRDTIAGNLDRGQESEEIDKKETDEPTAININKNEPPQDDYEKQDENLFGAHHPTPSSNTYQTEDLAGGQSYSEDEEDMTKYHEYNPNRPPPPRPEQGSIDRIYDPDMTNHRVITSQGSKFFIPVNPLYKPMVYQQQQQQQQQRPQPNLAIENHKQQNTNTESSQQPVHLTFDRIAPEFYDKKPWTPLLNRPNLDKRPRVELLTRPTDIPSHPEERTTQIADYSETVGHDHDHFYDRTGDALSSSIGSNEPIRHAPTEPINSDEDHDGDANGSTSTEEVSAEVAQGVKPPDIPAFTLYIPHIDRPNPNLQSNLSLSLTKDPVHSADNSPAANERRDDLNTTSPSTSTTNGHISDSEATPHNAQSSQAGDVHNNNDHHDNIGGDVMDELRKMSEENTDKDEDYFDGEDEITGGDDPPQTKIYKLDADNVDIVPDTLATAKPLPPVRELRREDTQESSALPSPQMPKDMSSPVVDEESGELFEKVHTITHDENSSPELPSVSTKTTNSDAIMSTLGSLNLMKTSGMPQNMEPEDAPLENDSQEKTETDAKVQLPPSEEKKENSNQSSQNGTELPLFPPVRSYVGINQPLRPKPDGESSEEGLDTANDFPFLDNKDESDEKTVKQVRVYKENEDQLPNFTFTTTSSLNKVLSMMMNFENDKNKLTSPALTNISSQNVHLVVADNGKAIVIKNGDNANNLDTNATSTISNNREPKLFNRDPKIDSRFSDPAESVAHVPVPLLNNDRHNNSGLTKPSNNKPNTTTKISSVTMGANSPVYKFILRKGQSVEDLLKEIFQNYTEKSATTKGTHVGIGVPSLPIDGVTTKMTILQRDDIEMEEVTTATTIRSQETSSTSSATTARNPVSAGYFHSSSFNSLGSTVPSHLKSTTLDPQVKTSTSIVVNGNFEPCPTNNSFRCASNGKCISGFGRCNGIRDCPDNSDEKGCLCVDHLRAQMLHRKICDGVPDCKDFSDEYQCDWCSPGQYICAGSRACVNRDKICDGKRDCPRGDDENECVKIGSSDTRDELEDLSPTYHRSGHLMVRKKGVWGKLCVETFSTVVSHWEVKDLARAVCKALTFSDFETVERVEDDKKSATEPYYELYYGTNETVDSDEGASGYASSESTPRSSLGFKQTQCKSRLVVKVTCQDLQCGTAPRAFTQAARIVGGANALPGEWPWQAALYRDGEYQCGATLISSRWLLSAGHCFYHAQDDHWVARLGTLRRGATVLSPYEQVVKITHVFLHPQYKDVGFVNDVSLLRLEHEVNFTDFVRPVCLPGRDTRIRDGRMCTVVGWGQLFEVGRVFPDTLQEVQLPLISTAECRKRTLFLPLYKLTDEMFCAGFDRGGRDACLGDSGGPLMCSESDGRWSLYGVTSNGYGCARANRPGVYTKVARYLDWIYDKMSQDSTYTYRDKAKPCNGHRCPLGECLEPRRLCNGFSDCLDGSDERNCTWS